MKEVSEVAVFATGTLIEWGVVGAVLVISLVVNLLLGWLLWRTRNKYTDHLEEHYNDLK